jgi:DNA-binding PadR family transcriptional regulator
MADNAVQREFFIAFWKVHILHHAAERPVWGQWMLEELREHGFNLSPGTLYPILERMEERGWLRAKPNPDAGPKDRKEYRLTPVGAKVLAQVREQVDELNRELQGKKHK